MLSSAKRGFTIKKKDSEVYKFVRNKKNIKNYIKKKSKYYPSYKYHIWRNSILIVEDSVWSIVQGATLIFEHKTNVNYDGQDQVISEGQELQVNEGGTLTFLETTVFTLKYPIQFETITEDAAGIKIPIEMKMINKKMYGGIRKVKIYENQILNFSTGDNILIMKDTGVVITNWKDTELESSLEYDFKTNINDNQSIVGNTVIVYKMDDEITFNDQTLINFLSPTEIRFKQPTMIIIENNTSYDQNFYGKSLYQFNEVIGFNNEVTYLVFGKHTIITFSTDCEIKFLEDTETMP